MRKEILYTQLTNSEGKEFSEIRAGTEASTSIIRSLMLTLVAIKSSEAGSISLSRISNMLNPQIPSNFEGNESNDML